MIKKIAVLGSSGGNLYNLGGSDPAGLVGEISSQCDVAGIEIAFVQFIQSDASMDRVQEGTRTSLFTWNSATKGLEAQYSGTLREVNDNARVIDSELCQKIIAGDIDGLIMMSPDPNGANAKSIEAAVQTGIPIVGTGGTSMSIVRTKGGNVISVSGTTATTNRTRAISFIASLSKFWGLRYRPTIDGAIGKSSSNPFAQMKLRGIMMATLPCFIALSVVVAVSRIPALAGMSHVVDLFISALPVALAAIAAKQISGLDAVGIGAGVVAGFVSGNAGVLGGLAGGIITGVTANYVFRCGVLWKFAMTTVNIAAGAVSALVGGLVVHYLLASLLHSAADAIIHCLDACFTVSPILSGLVAGLLIWPSILKGFYHAIVLPLILLEMSTSGNSYLGAVDMCGLAMVAAGVNLACSVFPRKNEAGSGAFASFLVNLKFGTFVESIYPVMFSSRTIYCGTLCASGLAGVVVGLLNVKTTAYLPAFVSPLLSNNIFGCCVAMIVAAAAAFIVTLVANIAARNR